MIQLRFDGGADEQGEKEERDQVEQKQLTGKPERVRHLLAHSFLTLYFCRVRGSVLDVFIKTIDVLHMQYPFLRGFSSINVAFSD